MNQSMQTGNYHLPRLAQNESANLKTSKGLSSELHALSRSMSHRDSTKVSITRKLVLMQDVKEPQEYDNMTEKQLLREHQKLLKILKKFQEIIDINLQKKQKEKEKEKEKGKQTSKEDIYNGEVANNRKIIENYLKELKELEGLKKYRKLHEVIEEKSKVQGDIAKLKKEIFNLKNQDNMAGRNLVADRSIIQKELKEHEKDLKTQLVKKGQYTRKMEELSQQLLQLKKECEGINPNEISNQRTHNEAVAQKLSLKKQELEEVTKSYVNFEEAIQENMVAKAKRNRGVAKQIENCDKKVHEIMARIAKYRQKISRYQQAMQISPDKHP